jgi:hypothetical protein
MSLIISRFQELPADLVRMICLFTGKFRYDKNGNLHSIINIHDYLHIDYHLQEMLHKHMYRHVHIKRIITVRINYGHTVNIGMLDILNNLVNHLPISVISPKPDNTKKDKVQHTYNQNPKDILRQKFKKNHNDTLRLNYKKNFRRLL